MQVKKTDSANCAIEFEILNSELETKKDQAAKSLSKTMKVDGFRKGKVPVAVVKSRFAEKLQEDAVRELVNTEYNKGLKELELTAELVLGEPIYSKFDQGEEKIEIEIKLSTRPEVTIDGYKDIIPEVTLPEVLDEEIQTRIENYALQVAEPVKVEKEVVEKGDFAVIDFVGFIDGEEMENGAADNHPLELGSNSFIPGFEDQVEGMKVGEKKEINVTFPESYQSADIAGKPAKFDVTLKEIRVKELPEINDALAQDLLKLEDATVETLKEEMKKELINEKKMALYAPKKNNLLEKIVETFTIDLPNSVVESELNIQLNQRASQMKEDEIKDLEENEEKLVALREEVRKEAQERVKLTFLIDEMAKAEEITVEDEDLMRTLYMEAYRSGQNPDEYFNYYKDNNLLPAVKMQMIEDKLLTHLLDSKVK